MIEMKELQALVVCAEVHSFTRAAEILYTTQPNVSKMIRKLEEKLGFPVFYRDNKGLRLTQKGKRAYEYAAGIVAKEEELSELLQLDSRDEFCVTMNPSSRVAELLTKYYQKYRRNNVRYCFLEGSVSDVLERVGSGKSEIGLIYYRKKQQAGITYQLQRRELSFHELKKLRLWFYYGAHAPHFHRANQDHAALESQVDTSLKLIQCYEDEFAFSHYQDSSTYEEKKMAGSVSVLTNSDYIMNRMLKETDLCNISAEDLGNASAFEGYAVGGETAGNGEEILFGYVIRSRGGLSEYAEELLIFLQEQLKNS